jgi:hypothetical protein
MLAKVGSTDFTMIASKQEGETVVGDVHTRNRRSARTSGDIGNQRPRIHQNKYFYFADPRAFIGPRPEKPQIEVYRTLLPQEKSQGAKTFQPGWVMPDSVGDGQSIRDAATRIKNGSRPLSTSSLLQDFELLTFGTDYDFIIDAESNQTIGIELFDPIADNATKALAVSYINQAGQAVGGSYHSLGIAAAGDTLMLKMLKAPDPRDTGPFGTTWRLMIRNIYNLGLTNIDLSSLKVEIVDEIDKTRLNTDTRRVRT